MFFCSREPLKNHKNKNIYTVYKYSFIVFSVFFSIFSLPKRKTAFTPLSLANEIRSPALLSWGVIWEHEACHLWQTSDDDHHDGGCSSLAGGGVRRGSCSPDLYDSITWTAENSTEKGSAVRDNVLHPSVSNVCVCVYDQTWKRLEDGWTVIFTDGCLGIAYYFCCIPQCNELNMTFQIHCVAWYKHSF